MSEITTRAALLDVMAAERERLEALLARLSDAQLTGMIVSGEMTGKDVMAHVFDWEERCLRWYTIGEAGEMPERPEPGMTWDDLDLLNRQIYERHRDRALDEVRAEFAESYRAFRAAVETMADDELFTPGHYAWTGTNALVVPIRANSDWHYAEHARDLEAWLAAQGR